MAEKGKKENAGKRVVLCGSDVLWLEPGETVDIEAIDAVLKAAHTGKAVEAAVLKRALGRASHTGAFREMATVEAPDDRRAIVEVAGKPNTPDAKPGRWKALPLARWKGTANYDRPPEPLVGVSWTD